MQGNNIRIDGHLADLMRRNIETARQIYHTCRVRGLLDFQEFIDWQDKLNEISIMYDK